MNLAKLTHVRDYALRLARHVTAWHAWQTRNENRPRVKSQPDHEGKAREALAGIVRVLGPLPPVQSPLTLQEWQFIDWIIAAFQRQYSGWHRLQCAEIALESYNDFLRFEDIKFGDDHYDWSEHAAICFALDYRYHAS